MMEVPPGEIAVPTFLTESEEWHRGFEVGVVYTLMLLGAPVIMGAYRRENEEQLFLLASQQRYTFEWKKLNDTRTNICFTAADLLDDASG